MKTKDEIINEAIDRLSELTGEDFHGYRSEIWGVIASAMKKQDRNTRHACAEAVLLCGSVCETPNGNDAISPEDAHAACMNARAI